jgi:hypothetical protein
MTLADAPIQRFLLTKKIAVLATVQADGAPLAMPMWFLHGKAALTMINVAGTQRSATCAAIRGSARHASRDTPSPTLPSNRLLGILGPRSWSAPLPHPDPGGGAHVPP